MLPKKTVRALVYCPETICLHSAARCTNFTYDMDLSLGSYLIIVTFVSALFLFCAASLKMPLNESELGLNIIRFISNLYGGAIISTCMLKKTSLLHRGDSGEKGNMHCAGT